ncbi:TetR/AcrR family transcriptional regulator [Rhodococcus sp. PSBB049]|uniref:TetR/AcrR family transcriptional regulator n=1 Tax=Rhodococcus sp. PSBB049 TaxID=2812863 RepID=UPI001981A82D|nr:TetR/AcrR family transcriptional regulator [Rhodococcus sp. PSBB049]QSE72519.1 TetR/AcrR family transcriptional regulator [Rhodococcus sp. PSBB049]
MGRLAVADRRALLLAAASRIIARDGIAEMTTRAIANEAGMQQGAFHYCFRSKEELLVELIRVTVDDLVTRSSAAVTMSGDLYETIRSALRGLWENVVDPADKQLALYELTMYALRNPDLAALSESQYRGYTLAATRFLEAVAARADVEWTVPVPILARLLVSVVDGLGLTWLADRDDDAAHAVLDTFARQLAGSAIGR